MGGFYPVTRACQDKTACLTWDGGAAKYSKADEDPKLEKAKVEDLADDQILRRLDESGFIDRLYASYGVK
jgi:hypothetical protein